jgi:aspartate-semialdehyde dehydrogenase
MAKIPVGILGATGAVGQRFIQLLEHHPWFEITALAASDRSEGLKYEDACRWLLPSPIPEPARRMTIQPIEPGLDCQLVFSALPSNVAGETEIRFAQAGYAVSSNASSHRMGVDVPLLIPEVNPDHTGLLAVQRASRGWKGFIVTNPNCSSTELALAFKPLHERFGLCRVFVATLQALSGAGYPGVASLDIVDNLIPYIKNEEDKVETEPGKLLGKLVEGKVAAADFKISAQCNRIAVREGHTACVAIEFQEKPTVEAFTIALEEFRGNQEVVELPSTPPQPLLVHRQPDRPQPILDRDAGGGMIVHIGRVRPDPLFDVKFVVLGHNTVRGAAGCAIHNAELLKAQGWL